MSVLFVLVSRPVMPVSLNMNMAMPSWYVLVQLQVILIKRYLGV